MEGKVQEQALGPLNRLPHCQRLENVRLSGHPRPGGIQVKPYPLRPREANIQLHRRASRGGLRPHSLRVSLTKVIPNLTF